MKNNLLKISLTICLLVVCLFSITGCFNFGLTIQFETWGGTNISTKHYEYNSTVFTSDFSVPTKTGYKFLNWYYDDKFENEITGQSMVALNMNVTYYAKYELDEEYFMSTSNYYEWDNDKSLLTIEHNDLWTDWYIEIDKTNDIYGLNKITVDRIDQSQFVCKDVIVYDLNGKTMIDKNPNTNVFELEDGVMYSTKFVIKVSTQMPGACRVNIN